MTRLSLLALALLASACVLPDDEEPDTSEVESHGTTYQGTTYQGTTYQGTTYQGTTYQGTTYQGTTYQGTVYSGVLYGTSAINGSASLNKSTLEVWRKISSTRWEQRLPTKLCYWNAELQPISCTSYSLASSPLEQTKFRGRFTDPNTGGTRYGTLRITGVTTDPTYAMHPLNDAGANGAWIAYNGTTCTNVDGGCRRNTDLYLYDLQLVDTNGSTHPFCYPGEKAFAFAGTWDLTGKHTGSSTQFTFACTNGTIAKCARWGYRPFGYATTVGANRTSKSMPAYHQSCVRAATADYCANGRSFTRDNTLIDIYDYEPQQEYASGFIPRLQSVLYETGQKGATALQWESAFDNKGAIELDFERYNDGGGVTSACEFTFSPPTAPTPTDFHKPYTRDTAYSGPVITVDTSTVCSHDETTLGDALDFRCSACTTRFWGTAASHCIMRGGKWTQDCVDYAKASWFCPASERMAAHSECTVGTKLYQFGSACTLRLCSNPAYASCCTSSWTSTCTAAANTQCVGGQEGFGGMPLKEVGFCGVATGGPIILNGG